jgi:nicotinamide mononucleotide (NMN) deamidase PncC
LLQHLSANIYGFGSMTLEQHVLHRLRERGESAGIAEIGSGGAILAALSGSEELSGAVRSGFVAGNRHELARLLGVDVMVPDHEAENDGVWQVLADAVAERLECDWGLVTGPVSRQNGTLRMPVALRTPEGRVSCEWIPLGDTKPWDRDRLVTRVLDMLRRTLNASSE